MKDEIEVELNEAGTEISISSRGEIRERSFIDAEISGRVRISHHELMEGFRKAFPIPNNVVLDQIEVGFEEEEDILIVMLPKLTREEEPSGVEIEETNEANIREEKEDDDDKEERTSMTIEAEETSPDYNKEKAQEQQNLGEVEPKNSTGKFKGKPDGKLEAGSREATTKIAIEDNEGSEFELIIEEVGFTITASISKDPVTSKSEEEEKGKEEEAPEQKNLNKLEVSKSLETLESEAEGLESKEIAIRAQIDDKEEETELIVEELDFTIIPLPLDEPIIFEASEVEEKEKEEEEEEEKMTLEEKEKKQKNLYELEPTISLGESECEPDEEIERQCKEIAIEAKIINDDEEKKELIIEEPNFTTTPPPQEEQLALKASDSKEEKKEEEEEKEKATREEVVEQKDLDELELKKILEALEGELDEKTNLEHRKMTIEAQNGDKEEKNIGPIKEESDFTRTSPSEEHVASKISKLKEKEKKSTREEVPKQNDLDKLEPKKISEVLEDEFDGKTKQEHREMTIESQTGDKEKEKTGLIRKEPDFTKTPPLEEPVTSKASELKEEKENAAGKGVAEQHNLDELKPKKILEAIEGESDGKTKLEHREMAIEVQSGDKEGKKIEFIREEPDFTRTPPSEKSFASKTFELKEEEKKATREEVLEKKDLDELEPKKISKTLESEYDGKTKLEHQGMVIEAQTDDKKEEKIRLIKEDPGFTRTPPPSEELIASKAFELKEKEERAIGEEVSQQKDLGELELKKNSNVLESESDGKTKPEHREMAIEAQIGDEKEEKTILVRDEPYFIRTPPLSEKPVASKTFELKEEEEKTTGGKESEQKDLDKLGPKKISNALEGEYDGKTKPESREMTIEAQTDKKKEEKIGLIREEPNFTRISQPSEKSIVSKAFELKEEDKKATEKEVQEQKDLGELESKKISEVLEDESDGKTKPEYQEMAIEAQTDNKEEEKNGLTREELDFTRTPPPSEELITSKAFELKEEKEKATEEKVPEQKDLDEIESKKILKALESEPDGKAKSEHQEMAIEAQTGDKEEEKTGPIREETDFTRTHLPSKESVASKASELKAKEEKTTREEVSKHKDLDELDQKKISEALEGEFDRKTKQEHQEMTIEAQTRDKEEEKSELTREEPDFTRTSHPSEELVTSKASELKKEEEKATGEGVSEQRDLDELKPKKILEALEGESDGKTKQEHREMAIEVQIGDKEEKKNLLIREESDFTRIPPLGKPITSKTFELKEEEEKATWEKVSKQKNLDELEPKKISKALESESDGKTKPEHRGMTIEAQTGDKEEEEKIRLIREEPGFTRTPPLSEELIASKSFELKEEEEKAIGEKIPEQKDLDELESRKILKTLEDGPDGKTKLEHREMTIEAQIGDKEEKKIRLIGDEPDFTRTPPLEKLVASKVSELKEKGDKATREEVSKQKDLGELELKKISKVLESESDGKTKPEHREMAIEVQIGDKKKEKIILIRDESDFIRTPSLTEKPVASKTFELKEEEEKTTWEEVLEQKDLDELGPKKISEALEDESDGKTKPESRETIIEAQTSNKKEEKIELIREEPDFTRTSPPPLKESIVSKTFELKEEDEKATEKEVQEQKDLGELESKKILKVLEDESDGKTKPEYQEMAIEAQTGNKEEEKNGLTREEPDFTRTPPPSEELIASKAFELKEEKEKATEEEAPEQKDIDEIESKKILKALESKPDGKTKSEHQEMAIEAQTGDKEEEKTGPIREETNFTRTHLPSKESVASKAFELKAKEEKTTGEEVSKHKDLDELDQKKNSEALESEFDRKTKQEHQEMTIEAQTRDKEEEKSELIREEPDFTRTPHPSEELVTSKAFELKKEEEKATGEGVSEQQDLDELKPKKILEALEGESDGKTKQEHREMTIEAQTSDKEEKVGPIGDESDFTRIPLPSEESVASKASELKEEEEKTTGEAVSEQKDLDELDQKKISEVLEGESNGKIKPEYREMTIKAQTGDKEEKNRLTRVEPDFTRTPPPSEESIASKAFELKEEEEKATREEVSEQKDLDELESKEILEALEGEPVGKRKPKHQEMAIEAQTGAEEEKNGLIRKEPYFTKTTLPSEEPVASKASKLKEEKEKVIRKEVPEHKYLDELEPKKILEALEGESNGKTKREYQEMTIEEQTGDKEEEKIRLIRDGPYFIGTSLPSEEPVASKASELKKEEEKAARKEVQERKDLHTLELEKGLEASEGEPNEEIELVPTKMPIEAPSEHKEEEQTRIHTEELEFIIAPPALEEPILSNASKLKEEEEEEKAHKENTEEPKILEKKIQSKTFEEEKKGKKEKDIEEKSQEHKSLDELQVKKNLEEIKGELCRETKPEPKKTAIGTQTKYKEEEETRRITEEPDITVSPSSLEDLIASKASKSKEENEEQHEKAPTEEIPYSPPISPNIMAKPKSNGEQLDTTDSHEERDRDVEVPEQALETFECIESSKQEGDRHGFGKEDAKEPKNVEEITHDPAPKTLTRTVTPKDVDSDRRRDGEHEAQETKIQALREDDREIVSDVDGGEDASREWQEGESSDRDREESREEMETRKEEKGNNGNGMNGIGKSAQRKRRRRRKRGSSFHLPPTDVIVGSVFVLTLAALVIRLIKKRR